MDKNITVEDVAKLYKEKYELLQLKYDMNIVYEGLKKMFPRRTAYML